METEFPGLIAGGVLDGDREPPWKGDELLALGVKCGCCAAAEGIACPTPRMAVGKGGGPTLGAAFANPAPLVPQVLPMVLPMAPPMVLPMMLRLLCPKGFSA
jgi:hypothetical protein